MGYFRFLKKTLIGVGNPLYGHLLDAAHKKIKTKKDFKECLSDSVNETIREDLPGFKHIYQMGHKDGKEEGTVEQAERDEIKFRKQKEEHDKDRKDWEKINKEKDEMINELGKQQFDKGS